MKKIQDSKFINNVIHVNDNKYRIHFIDFEGTSETKSLEELVHDLLDCKDQPKSITFNNGVRIKWDANLAYQFAYECEISEKQFIQSCLCVEGGKS